MIPKPQVPFDTEIYRNYWLLRFKNGHHFELRAGESLTADQRKQIMWLFNTVTAISFNGRHYDIPMITAALMGYTPDLLKNLSNQIITENIKPWELNLMDWQPADHIDLIEVAPGMGSLKLYAARIHSKKIQDLPYDHEKILTESEIANVFEYCGNDLEVTQDLLDALRPQLHQRSALSNRYGIDLRSKSDAQLAETVLRHRCEKTLGQKIYKSDIDYNLRFKYKVPEFIQFSHPSLVNVLNMVRGAVFKLGANGMVEMPPQLDDLAITLGRTAYKMGIGGLHSQEKKLISTSTDAVQIRMVDVASYYPNLMINSGEYPKVMGQAFIYEFSEIKAERLECKAKVKELKKSGDTSSPEYVAAKVGDDGGKIMINGTFGKCGSPYSVLFAPEMLIQTTVTGQLALLMLIEWLEYYSIPVVSANTDGLVLECPRHLLAASETLIHEWEKRTSLEMEIDDYHSLYARDVNNYFAIKTPDDVKRKGEYALSGLVEKKNPDVEICSDAVAEYLARGTPIRTTIAACRDIRKFMVVQRVSGGAVKLWGPGPVKGAKVSEMVDTLTAHGWVKQGRKWERNGIALSAGDAYESCFGPQYREYLGKVVRWYYGKNSPGTIVYATNGNTVGRSSGARPCMVLPDQFPDDIDYDWYAANCESILNDLGVISWPVL